MPAIGGQEGNGDSMCTRGARPQEHAAFISRSPISPLAPYPRYRKTEPAAGAAKLEIGVQQGAVLPHDRVQAAIERESAVAQILDEVA